MMTAKNLSLTRVSRSHSFLCILLFYEAIIQVVIAALLAPVISENGGTLQSREIRETHNVKHSIVMPVWARKAGGNWRPELLSNSELVNKANPIHSIDEDEEVEGGGYKEDSEMEAQKPVDSESSSSSLMSPSTKEIIIGQRDSNEMGNESAQRESKREGSIKNGDDDDEYIYDELEPEELECPEDHFWHIRGLKCVPLTCPGGNTWRDQDTGECILKRYGYRNRWNFNRPYKPQ